MKKERKIINTNIRLNLMNEQDRQAWNYLRGMDRKKYKSYTKAVVLALNDYFSRQEQIEADPYLETRKKEDEFLNRVEEAVERGGKAVHAPCTGGKSSGVIETRYGAVKGKQA